MHQAQWSPERPLPPPVSLASQSHHEKPPEVTCTSRGNPRFPASTREGPRETFFNTSTQCAAPSHLWTLAHGVPSAYIDLCLDRVRSLSSVLPWCLVLPHHPMLLWLFV